MLTLLTALTEFLMCILLGSHPFVIEYNCGPVHQWAIEDRSLSFPVGEWPLAKDSIHPSVNKIHRLGLIMFQVKITDRTSSGLKSKGLGLGVGSYPRK